jgi:hypothetical protein
MRLPCPLRWAGDAPTVTRMSASDRRGPRLRLRTSADLVRRRRRGSVTAAFVAFAAVAATLVYTGARITAERPGLPGACRMYVERYRDARDDGPTLADAPQIQRLRSGGALSADELEDLRSRLQQLKTLYTGLNQALEDVARAAKQSPQARVQAADEAEMFATRIRELNRRYSAGVTKVVDARDIDELVAALNGFGPSDDGPSLTAYRSLYAAVAAEPACHELLTIAHGMPLAAPAVVAPVKPTAGR